MKYEYQGIKLGDSIEKIINLLNNENTKLNDFGTDLIYKTGSTIEDISTRIYICLYTGIVVMIKVFDQDFCLVEDLKIGLPITCLLYTSPSPRDGATSRMPSSA